MNDRRTKLYLNPWSLLGCIAGGMVWYWALQGFVAFVRWCGR